MAAEFQARSIMAAPLVVSNESIGAAVFLHCSDPDFFNPDLAAKATILAGQLGSLLEANRLTQVSREEHRRTKILAEVAQALRSAPESTAVIEAVADRLRVLLRTRLVCMLLREGTAFSLRAVAAESPQLAASVRARHDRRGLQFAADLASRAVAAGEPISVAIDPATLALGELVPPGVLIAAPFRTSLTQGAVLVYPRQEGIFSAEEKSLISVVTGFGAVAIANAELYTTARAQAHELHQLLEISAELSSIGQLDEFLQQFALRAADFLGFGRGFIGLLEGGAFHVRWAAEGGQPKRVDFRLPEGPASRALLRKEVFWSDDPSKVPGANLEILAQFDVKHLLTVPLLDTNGDVLGMFGVLDRLGRAGISPEEIRRARALAAQVAVALEVTRNLHQSEQHRRKAESLMGLALELNGHLRLPEFARSFVGRAAKILNAHQAALVVKQGTGMETLVLQRADGQEIQERTLLRRFSHAIEEALRPSRGRYRFLDRDGTVWCRAGLRTGWQRWHAGAAAGCIGGIGRRPVPGETASNSWPTKTDRSCKPSPATPRWLWKMPACLRAWSRPTVTGWKFSMPSAISSWCTTRPTTFCASTAPWPISSACRPATSSASTCALCWPWVTPPRCVLPFLPRQQRRGR